MPPLVSTDRSVPTQLRTLTSCVRMAPCWTKSGGSLLKKGGTWEPTKWMAASGFPEKKPGAKKTTNRKWWTKNYSNVDNHLKNINIVDKSLMIDMILDKTKHIKYSIFFESSLAWIGLSESWALRSPAILSIDINCYQWGILKKHPHHSPSLKSWTLHFCFWWSGMVLIFIAS